MDNNLLPYLVGEMTRSSSPLKRFFAFLGSENCLLLLATIGLIQGVVEGDCVLICCAAYLALSWLKLRVLRAERLADPPKFADLVKRLVAAKRANPRTTVHQFLAREEFEYDQKHDYRPISGPPTGD